MSYARVSVVEFEEVNEYLKRFQSGGREVLSVSVFTSDDKLFAAILHK